MHNLHDQKTFDKNLWKNEIWQRKFGHLKGAEMYLIWIFYTTSLRWFYLSVDEYSHLIRNEQCWSTNATLL